MDAPAVLGVDCGGTTLRLARFEEGSVVPTDRRDVATPAASADIPAVIAEAAGPLSRGIAGIGIGVAGLVDHETGTLVWMPHTRGHDVPVARTVGELLGVQAVVDNDASLATLAEARLGAAAGRRFVLGVFLGTGIGGGISVDGRPERGRAHLGEIGHMVIDPDGPACPCGNRGCWEAFVSGTALAREAAALAVEDPGWLAAGALHRPGAEHLGAAAAAGDGRAAAVLARTGEWLGRGLANLVAILDPDVVVVGGRVAELGAAILGPAARVLRSSIEGAAHREATPLVRAAFGEAAGLVGAALLARERR